MAMGSLVNDDKRAPQDNLMKLSTILVAAVLCWTGNVAIAAEEWSAMPFCQTDREDVKRCLVGEIGRVRGSAETKIFLGYSCTDDYSPEARAWNIAKKQAGRPRSEWAPSGETIMLSIPVWEDWLSQLGVRTRDPKVSMRWSSGQRERIKTRFERFDRDEPEGVVDLTWHIENTQDTEPFIENMKRHFHLDLTLPFFAVDPIKARFRFVNAIPSIQRAMKECGLSFSALGEIW